MIDNKYQPSRTSIPAGRVVFHMVNDGAQGHRPVLIPLGDDFPPIDEQIRGSERRLVNPEAAVNERPPSISGTFAIDLAPGKRYAFVCFATTADGVPHSKLGMTWEFRTEGSPASTGN